MSWLTKLSAALVNEADKIPAGWFCEKDEAKRLKIGRNAMFVKIREAMRLGILERKKFRVMRCGSVRHIYYYREVK